MRQASLWKTERELERSELWDQLPNAVRAEFVERLVRIVVASIVKTNGPQGKGGENGLEGAAKPPRA